MCIRTYFRYLISCFVVFVAAVFQFFFDILCIDRVAGSDFYFAEHHVFFQRLHRVTVTFFPSLCQIITAVVVFVVNIACETYVVRLAHTMTLTKKTVAS